MSRSVQTLTIQLCYMDGCELPERGFFSGGVVEPEHLEELAIWVDEDLLFSDAHDEFRSTGKDQVHIGETRRSLFEFGRYLIALSKFDTENPRYHDHFENLAVVDNRPPVHLIGHLKNTDD